MLERVKIGNLVLYQSPLLARTGVPHAFTTRLGGVSRPPFDSLNFQPASRSVAHLEGPAVPLVAAAAGRGDAASPGQAASPALPSMPLRSSAPPADQYETVAENFRLLAGALGRPGMRTICLWQVHGREVCRWPHDAAPAAGDGDADDDAPAAVVARADALLTADRQALIAVRVADCAPVLLAHADGHCVAAVHAGWRGVVAGIVHETVAAMIRSFKISPADIVAAIGPCISAEHFQIGLEVADALDGAGLGEAVRRDFHPRPHADLQQAIAIQLRQAGTSAGHIDGNDRCTFRDRAEFYSHRRDEGRTGRMAAVIAAK